jgi:hypothetical protein
MMSNYSVGDKMITPGGKLGEVSSVQAKITITWDNGLSAEYTPKQLQAWKYQIFLEDKETYSVGDRVKVAHHKEKYYSDWDWGIIQNISSKKIDVKMGGKFIIAVDIADIEKDSTQCNSNTPVSLQELQDLNSESKQPELRTSSQQNYSLKTTPTLKQFSDADIQVSPYTATLQTITPNQDNSTSTQLDFLVPEHPLQEMVRDLTTPNQSFGLKPCDVLPTEGHASSSSKILQDLSLEDYEQFLGDSEWLATSGTIRKSYQLRNSDRPKKEKDFSSLPTPTTYAKGSTGCRPAGQTRLEQKLKPYLTKGDKLNPAVPGWMMGFPVGWVEKVLMDGGETISIQLPFTQEYVTTSTNAENVTTSTPVQSAHSRQPLQLNESVTSPALSQVTRFNARPETYIINQSESLGIIKQNLGFGFVVDWFSSESTYNWERDDQLISEMAIAPQHLIDQFLSTTRCAKEEKSKCQVIPENFLEEAKPQPEAVQKAKSRQRKGCLYKYLENKKLKNGTIASYPRVIGHRNPDNPTHWRWGFNWEEKIDGEWKGRSIGSVPLGAIPLIQSMQNEGVPLEEIIGFIKRAKAKKS